MKDLDACGENIDRVTVANELGRQGQLESVDGLSYLVSLDDAAAGDNDCLPENHGPVRPGVRAVERDP